MVALPGLNRLLLPLKTADQVKDHLQQYIGANDKLERLKLPAMPPGLVLTRNARIGQPTSEQHLKRNALATAEFPKRSMATPVNNIPVVPRSHNPTIVQKPLPGTGFTTSRIVATLLVRYDMPPRQPNRNAVLHDAPGDPAAAPASSRPCFWM